jgi:hypothetical protein
MKPNTAFVKTIQIQTADTLIPPLAETRLVKVRCTVLYYCNVGPIEEIELQ